MDWVYAFATHPPRQLVLMPIVLLASSLLVLQAGAASDPLDCHEEVASVDYSDSSENLETNRFQHVFQHVDEYPYFRNVGPAYVGIKTSRYYPDSIVPNRDYWRILDGRVGVGAENHYSLIEDIRGEARFAGVSVNINVKDELAFFLYDRLKAERSFYYAHVARNGLLDVIATTPAGPAFLEVVKSRNWRIGHGTALRLWSARFRDRDAEWAEDHYAEKMFRTIFFVNHKVEVAGVEHNQRKICRHAWAPLVVTNSDKLVPAIEKELRKRGEILQVWMQREEEKQATAREEAERTRWVKVIEFSDRHRGNLRKTGSNDVRIGFRMSESNSGTVWARGHLFINGVDLGKVMSGILGDVGVLRKKRKRAKLSRKFESGDFLTSGNWNYFTDSRYVYDDNRYFECRNRVCSVHVRANKLTEIGWNF